MTALVTDTEHYTKVLNLAAMAKRTLWLGTADIKDLYVSQGGVQKPFLGTLSAMLGRGVEVRLIHAKEPGENFRVDFDRYPRLAKGLERMLCPRVHFKIIVIDQTVCYIGSANLTGAGMGMKAATRRNFEAGILTDDPKIVEAAIEEFDKVWRGSECRKCQRKQYCGDPIK
ncbi:MAG: phospholipase D family protein [Salinivirgaceae bacterium]|nr:phospholipase D family protein [Salinivirgaceae bacterium]